MKTIKLSLSKTLVCVMIALMAFTVLPGGFAQASEASAASKTTAKTTTVAPAPAPITYELCVYYYTNINRGPAGFFYDSKGVMAQGNGYYTSILNTNYNALEHVVYAPDQVMNKGMGPYTVKAANMKFVGWNTKQDGTGIMVYPGQRLFADAKVTRSESQNLFAIWAPALSIKYDINGGKGVNFTDEGNGSTTFTVSTKMIDNSKPGYMFVGWNTRADGTGTIYRCGSTCELKEPLTLYAQFIHLGII